MRRYAMTMTMAAVSVAVLLLGLPLGGAWIALAFRTTPNANDRARVVITVALTAVGMQLFSAAASPNGVWTIALAVVVLLGWLVGCVTIPTGGRGAPEIVLTPEAVWIWAGGHTRVRIPWAARPNLAASMTHRMRPHAVITGGAGGPVNFPIFVVPIGHVQLQSVLELYSIHAGLRGELSTGQGLQRVRALMTPPVQEGEGGALW